jgi:asparagine synthase (glutamine-hydrolysing)
MSTTAPRPPGLAAFSAPDGDRARARAEQVAAHVPGAVTVHADEHTHVVLWGELRDRALDAPLLLCRGARAPGHDVSPSPAWRLLAQRDDLHHVLPPFAAVDWDAARSRLVVAVDWLGMRHLYVTESVGLVGVSTSAGLLAATAGGGLDRAAWGVQSLLGWQLADATVFDGVRKVAPGAVLTLTAGRLASSSSTPTSTPDPVPAQDAPRRAADMLSGFVSGYLDDHPDAVLQLTGGHDSRILLGAIPRARRRDVEALTLAVPGSPDVAIAARLAADHGMRHRVVELRGLVAMTDEEAWSLCAAAARDLECAADPVAFASLRWAESGLGQQPRLSGLGGEVARGFYYFGPTRSFGVSRRLASALAQWRMFPNERVDPEALDPAFAAMADRTALDRIHRALVSASEDWWSATDEFYLWQRMQRWAGTLASATSFDRVVVNPMLDHDFLQLTRGLPPHEKKNMRFLSRILLELDPELADIPLDNRPSPRTYARPSLVNRARLGATQARKVAGKARQRWSSTTRPPAGGELLAAKVTNHLRANPSLVDPLRDLGMLRPSWLDELAAGRRAAEPSAIALLVNLSVACETVTRVSAGSGSVRR